MKQNKIRVYRNLLPIDHYFLKPCQCNHKTSHCSSGVTGFTPRSNWASHVRLPAPEECRRGYLPSALVLGSLEYGGYRMVMPADEETVKRELARHEFLRTANNGTSPVQNWHYDLWTKKWLRDAHKLKSLLGREVLELFLEKVSTYTPEMLPFVMSCGEPTNEPSAERTQPDSLIVIEA